MGFLLSVGLEFEAANALTRREPLRFSTWAITPEAMRPNKETMVSIDTLVSWLRKIIVHLLGPSKQPALNRLPTKSPEVDRHECWESREIEGGSGRRR